MMVLMSGMLVALCFVLPSSPYARRVKVAAHGQDKVGEEDVGTQPEGEAVEYDDQAAKDAYNKDWKDGKIAWWGIPSTLKRYVPTRQYSCKQETTYGSAYGYLDRWVTVTPDTPGTHKAASWVNPTAWKQWGEEALDLVDPEKAELPFQPFALRQRSEYEGKLLYKQISMVNDNLCEASYTMHCIDDESGKDDPSMEDDLQLIKSTKCAHIDDGAPKQTVISFGSFKNTHQDCAYSQEASFWRNKTENQVLVQDHNGEFLPIPKGHCVSISTLDPSSGVSLSPLDADLMGSGFERLAGDATKLQRLTANIGRELVGIAQGIYNAGGTLVEAGQDVGTVVEAFDDDLAKGGVDAGEKSVKWIKRLTLDTEVESCLCCNLEFIDTGDFMAEHCQVAYTLGGQDKSQTLKYAAKTAAGTLFNLAKTAGNWLVPFLGANLVNSGNVAACQYVCDLRQPHLFEPYRFAKVRKVPGLAMQTWFIPNPRTFFAAAGATDVIAEGAATSVAANVATDAAGGVVTGAVSEAVTGAVTGINVTALASTAVA